MAKVLIVTNFILIMLGELRFMGITGRGLENAFSCDTQEKWVMWWWISHIVIPTPAAVHRGVRAERPLSSVHVGWLDE